MKKKNKITKIGIITGLEKPKKRSVGERANILFDSIDLQIFRVLADSEVGVLDLSERLKIKHQNLKPHIDKLRSIGLIFAFEKGGKVLLTSQINNEHELSLECFNSEEDYREYLQEVKEHKILWRYLEKAESFNNDISINRLIDLDLRKTTQLKKLEKTIKNS